LPLQGVAGRDGRELRAAGLKIMVLGMSSVLEIERAIEGLPTAEMLEVAEWLDVRRGMIAASESVFQMLDEEEGEEAGNQWLG